MSTQIEKFTAIADKIREKTGTEDTMTANDFVDKIDDVYSAGQSSMVDENKIISKTVSGVGAIHLNDVSEIPHKIDCKVESVNLWTKGDVTYVAPESVEVTVCGKNLCKYPYIDGEEKETNGVTFTVNADMSITAKGTATAQAYFKLLLLPYLSGLTFKEDYVISDCSINVNSLTAYVNVSEGETVDKTFYPQIEYGSTPTDYAPYSATPYTVNAEGTVNIVSTHETSPIMNIIASNPDVNITVDYNKSYGMQTEHDRLWDTLQKNGGPANYHYKFAYSSFTDDTYNPIYPLRFTSSTNAAQSVFYATDITDTKVPIHAEGCNISGMFYRYGSAQPLKTIRELHVDEKTIINISTFTRTDNLENITFVGSIACDLIINWSKKLTKASITSIINALSDSENISGKEVRLSKTAVNNAFGIDVDNETTYPEGSEYYILRHSRDNWNFSYIDEG